MKHLFRRDITEKKTFNVQEKSLSWENIKNFEILKIYWILSNLPEEKENFKFFNS